MRFERHLFTGRRIARLAANAIVSIVIAVPVLALADVVLHVQFRFCLRHFSAFRHERIVPAVHGSPLALMMARAERGEVVLAPAGSPVAGVCPYCRWPAAMARSGPEELVLDDRVLESLPEGERTRVREACRRMIHQNAQGDEWATAVAVTPNEVWLGTVNSGLHAFDRRTGEVRSFRGGAIGDCVYTIRVDGPRVAIEHGLTCGGLWRETLTSDHGRSWFDQE